MTWKSRINILWVFQINFNWYSVLLWIQIPCRLDVILWTIQNNCNMIEFGFHRGTCCSKYLFLLDMTFSFDNDIRLYIFRLIWIDQLKIAEITSLNWIKLKMNWIQWQSPKTKIKTDKKKQQIQLSKSGNKWLNVKVLPSCIV